jgi:hypothetical protein
VRGVHLVSLLQKKKTKEVSIFYTWAGAMKELLGRGHLLKGRDTDTELCSRHLLKGEAILVFLTSRVEFVRLELSILFFLRSDEPVPAAASLPYPPAGDWGDLCAAGQ